MRMPRPTTLRVWILTLAATCAGLASAHSVAAQDLEVELDRERMVEFARAHIAINDARDEFHGAVARVHDPEGRVRAREEVEATIEAILEEAEMTQEEYDQITLLISLDGELRTMFEEVMAELEGGGSGR
jgi:predicted transcriptional regulator